MLQWFCKLIFLMRKRQALSRSLSTLTQTTTQPASQLRSTAMHGSRMFTPTCLWGLWNVCFSHSWPSRMWKVSWLMQVDRWGDGRREAQKRSTGRSVRWERERSGRKGAKWRGTHDWAGDRLIIMNINWEYREVYARETQIQHCLLSDLLTSTRLGALIDASIS